MDILVNYGLKGFAVAVVVWGYTTVIKYKQNWWNFDLTGQMLHRVVLF